MALEEIICEWLLKPRRKYKGMYVNILGLPAFSKYSEGTVRNSLTALKNKKYIFINNNHYQITKEGKKYFESKKKFLRGFKSPFSSASPKSLMVIYDIPEDQKTLRDWFRKQLRVFNYKMIQRSVWVGPTPLPKEFLLYVENIGLKDKFKTFKLAKPYTFKK